MNNPDNSTQWNETLSQEFINYGRYFVPERERQIGIIVRLLSQLGAEGTVIELCCGEGLLSEAILTRYPNVTIHGLDGSPEMLQAANQRLTSFNDRFQPRPFDLAEYTWQSDFGAVNAVVTSLAVHHLEGPGKAQLFRDIYQILAPGGVFIIADIIDPVHPQSKKLAAEAYDEIVRQRALAIDGHTGAFDFCHREGWNIFRYLDPDDIDKPSSLFDQLKWLEKAGFEKVDVFWLQAGHAIFGGWKPSLELGSPGR